MKRYEREISELLEKMDDFIPDDRPRRRQRRQRHLVTRVHLLVRSLWPTSFRFTTPSNVTPNSLLVAAIVMAFIAYLLHDVFRPAAPLASIAAVLLLLAALGTNVMRRHRRIDRRWRGQVIDLDDYRPAGSFALGFWWRKIRRALRRGPWNNY